MIIPIEYVPWLIAMLALMCCSAFFSSSEAALFYLSRQDRRTFQSGNRAQRTAAALLDDPERLLTAVLFWNLLVNISFFTIVSITCMRMKEDSHFGEGGAIVFGFGSLMAIIFFSELLPKNIAVLRTRLLATTLAIPLAGAVRLVDPLLPVFQTVNLLSRRLIWPNFKPDPYLEISDLERAVQLSTSDAALLEQEQRVLQNIVSLSETRVDEVMRPRMQFLTFRPPVSLSDLGGRVPPSGYVLVTEPDSEEVAGAIPLKHLSSIPKEHLEHYAEEVIYVPWCTTVGDTLERMRNRDREVAAVVNEFGETIGIITFDDILDTIFSQSASRSERLLKRSPIAEAGPGVWFITGMTSLRKLARQFGVELPSTKCHTVAGVVQEVLQRIPKPGDECVWGPFTFLVVDMPDRGQLILELRRTNSGRQS